MQWIINFISQSGNYWNSCIVLLLELNWVNLMCSTEYRIKTIFMLNQSHNLGLTNIGNEKFNTLLFEIMASLIITHSEFHVTHFNTIEFKFPFYGKRSALFRNKCRVSGLWACIYGAIPHPVGLRRQV